MPRPVIVAYFEDGRDLVTMAMNGWGPAEPAWWLNLQAHPDAVVQTRSGAHEVRARRALHEERERLWSRWAEIDKDLDDYAARRPTETAVVILEPRDTAAPGRSTASAEPARQDDRGSTSRSGPSMSVLDSVGVPTSGAPDPGRTRSAGTEWGFPALAGAVAFWLANLVISMTAVAAAYRSALSISYLPMLMEAAAGGVVVAGAVAFLLTHFPGRVPGGGPLRQAMLLSLGALVLLTVFLEVPAKLRSDVADPGYWLLVGTVFNTIRILALGVGVGLVIRARTIRRDRHRRVTGSEAPS
jgi:deazaflavin-dependent oxidoreductase (nitroreductase family)